MMNYGSRSLAKVGTIDGDDGVCVVIQVSEELLQTPEATDAAPQPAGRTLTALVFVPS